MTCLRLDQIYLYLEGELDEAGRRTVESHIRVCQSCRHAVEDRRVFHEAALSLPPMDVPAGFSKRILDRIPAKGATPLAWITALVSGAGTLFLIFLGAYLVTGQNLPSLLISANRGLWSFLGQSATALGKALGILVLGFKLLGNFLEGTRKVLEILAGVLLRAETLAPVLLVVVVLTALFIIGMKRIFPYGEKS